MIAEYVGRRAIWWGGVVATLCLVALLLGVFWGTLGPWLKARSQPLTALGALATLATVIVAAASLSRQRNVARLASMRDRLWHFSDRWWKLMEERDRVREAVHDGRARLTKEDKQGANRGHVEDEVCWTWWYGPGGTQTQWDSGATTPLGHSFPGEISRTRPGRRPPPPASIPELLSQRPKPSGPAS